MSSNYQVFLLADLVSDVKMETGLQPSDSLRPAYSMQLSEDVKPAIKFEDDTDDDVKPDTFSYPLSLSTSDTASGAMHKWTSSDSLNNLTSLFDRKPQRYYGMTGLNNLGNSCYLNSVVQCLANTRELRDYFLSK